MNMIEILRDPELEAEFVKAYEIAAPYRPIVRFRHDLLCGEEIRVENHRITDKITSEVYLDVNHMTADPDILNTYRVSCINCKEEFKFTRLYYIEHNREFKCPNCIN